MPCWMFFLTWHIKIPCFALFLPSKYSNAQAVTHFWSTWAAETWANPNPQNLGKIMDNQDSGVCILLYGCSACVCMCLHMSLLPAVCIQITRSEPLVHHLGTNPFLHKQQDLSHKTTRMAETNVFLDLIFFYPFDLIWYRLGSFWSCFIIVHKPLDGA